MLPRSLCAIVILLGLGLAHAAPVHADSVLTFESLADSTLLSSQYPGVTFSDAIVLTAGISLDEFEFPPHSGQNVVSDNGGPMTVSFADPVATFGGYFTYAEPLTLAAFDASNNLVAVTLSGFSNNEALSGDSGSSPNEFLMMDFSGGISEVTITGDPFGGSFTLDDLATTTASTQVPEPGSLTLLIVSLLAIIPFKLSKRLT